jgi:hypothetical protein
MTLSRVTRIALKFPTNQIRKLFYITLCRQKNPASLENYASELHQVMILRLSKVDQTSCEQTVYHGHVHFIPDDLDRVLATSPKKTISFRRSQPLYSLNDTFIVNFGSNSPQFLVIIEQGVELLCSKKHFSMLVLSTGVHPI